jgi:hypothetical protein
MAVGTRQLEIMWARNKLNKNGFALADARHRRALMIYDGFDMDQANNPTYQSFSASF